MQFEPFELDYAFDALEPHIDAATMEVHYEKHYKGYTNKLNAALKDASYEGFSSIEDLLANLDGVPEDYRTAVRNNGGGFLNHSIYFRTMSPNGGGEPGSNLGNDIAKTFGSFVDFKETFTNTAMGVFGSGWAWLAINENGDLHLHGMPNQDSPAMHGHTPLLGIDVWEHAYYLKNQNRRAEYVEAWWNVVDWKALEDIYDLA